MTQRTTRYEITRPGMLVKTQVIKDTKHVPMPKNQRSGYGNYEIKRNNFLAPEVAPRMFIGFDELKNFDVQQFGQLVQLGDKSLKNLLGVKIPDQTDTQWIEEYNRRKRMGESDDQLKRNLPLGRPQRTIDKNVSLGETSNTLQGNMNIIKAVLESGQAESRDDRASLGRQIVDILAQLRDLGVQLDPRNLSVLIRAVGKIGMPPNWDDAGFDHVWWTPSQVKADPTVLIFLLSNMKDSRYVVNMQSQGVNLTEFVQWTNLPDTVAGYFCNIATRSLESYREALLDIDDGADNGMINGMTPQQYKDARNAYKVSVSGTKPEEAQDSKEEGLAPNTPRKSKSVYDIPDIPFSPQTKMSIPMLKAIAEKNGLGEPSTKSGKDGKNFVRQDWIDLINSSVPAKQVLPKIGPE